MNSGSWIVIGMFLLFFGLVGCQSKIMYECGFKKSMFYGKNIGWAYLSGECETQGP